MKTRITLVLAAITLSAWTLTSAATINVPGDQATIAAAISAAVTGDTIQVAAGSFAGGTINKDGIKIRGNNWDVNPNTGSRKPETILTSTLAVGAWDNCSIEGFYMEGDVTLSWTGGVAGAVNVLIKRNILKNRTSTALANSASNGMLVTENLIENVTNVNQSGINCYGSPGAPGPPSCTDGMWITYNVIRNTNYAGIQWGVGNNWHIEGNEIYNTPRQGLNCGSGGWNGFSYILGNYIDNASFNNEENRGGIRFYAVSWSLLPDIGQKVYVMYNTVKSSSNGIRIRSCEDPSVPNSCQMDTSKFIIMYNNLIDNERFGFSHPGGTPSHPVDTLGDVELSENYVSGNTNGESEGPTQVTTGTLTQPQLPDSDGDGLKDWEEEFVYNSDPVDPDSDNDGVDDGIETELGTSPTDNADAPPPAEIPSKTADTDGDGFIDAYEVAQGSDPNSAASKPGLADANKLNGVDNVDAVIVYNVSLGNIPIQSYEFGRMDVDLNNLVNNADAIIIFNYFLNNVMMLPIYP